MRIPRFSLPLSLIILMDCSNPAGESKLTIYHGDPLLQEKGKFTLYDNKLLSAVVTELFESGNIKSESNYENGQLCGSVTSWYPDGKLESMRFYHHGEKEGTHQGWWPNGNPRFSYSFSKGMYDGLFKEWYSDGKRLHEFEYQAGQEIRAMGWRENGRTYINFVIRHGKKYGLTNARLCYSLKDEQGIYSATKNQP